MARERLLECSFLIPIRRDRNLSDGKAHRREAWKWLEKQLIAFGGGTLATELYKGFYHDPETGKLVRDLSQRYFVALAREKVGNLRFLLQEACVVFQQKCIYLSVAGHVEFVDRKSVV